MGAGASVPYEFSTLPTEQQAEYKQKYQDAVAAAEIDHVDKSTAQKQALYAVKTGYISNEIELNHALTIPLTDLQDTIRLAIGKGKTPLVIDNSEEDKVNTFFTYQSATMLDGKKMGLDKTLKKIPVQDIMDDARKKLVQALKFGQPLVIALTKSVTDFALTFTDEVAGANGSLDLQAGKYIPIELFKNAGRNCVSTEYLEALFRSEDKDQGMAISRNPDGFHVIITSQFAPEDYDEYLFGNDWGLPKPKENYQVIIIDDTKQPVRIESDADAAPPSSDVPAVGNSNAEAVGLVANFNEDHAHHEEAH